MFFQRRYPPAKREGSPLCKDFFVWVFHSFKTLTKSPNWQNCQVGLHRPRTSQKLGSYAFGISMLLSYYWQLWLWQGVLAHVLYPRRLVEYRTQASPYGQLEVYLEEVHPAHGQRRITPTSRQTTTQYMNTWPKVWLCLRHPNSLRVQGPIRIHHPILIGHGILHTCEHALWSCIGWLFSP